jgi:hypothetical protein
MHRSQILWGAICKGGRLHSALFISHSMKPNGFCWWWARLERWGCPEKMFLRLVVWGDCVRMKELFLMSLRVPKTNEWEARTNIYSMYSQHFSTQAQLLSIQLWWMYVIKFSLFSKLLHTLLHSFLQNLCIFYPCEPTISHLSHVLMLVLIYAHVKPWICRPLKLSYN